MKKIIFTFGFTALLLGFWSCQNNQEDILNDFKEKAINFEVFFEQVSNTNFEIDENKILLVNYEWNSKNKTITVLSSKEVEPSWGIAFDVAEQEKLKGRGNPTYTVSCNKGGKDGKGWTKSCSGKFSCGKLVYSCVEINGCATVCKAPPLAYAPQTKTFYISSDIKDLTTN